MPSNPVDKATTISGALIVLINSAVLMATALGWVSWDTTTQAAVNGFGVALINVGAIVGPMLWARKQVTPLSEPKDEDGTPLVRAGTGAPTQQQTRKLAQG